jgi:hypothetical protein
MPTMDTLTVDLYAEEIAVSGRPVAEFCVTCEVCEAPPEPTCANCDFCDTGECDCFSVFCDGTPCIA